tara:strand:+ start:8686 stop:9522 length:837 start_codon:yes stop_codon:yes gene_type:complete
MVNFEYKKPREIGEILTDTFQYIRLHYMTLGKGLLFFVMPFYVIQIALVGDMSVDIFNSMGDSEAEARAFASMFSGKYFLSLLMSVLGTSMLSVVTFKHVQLTSNDREADSTNLIENVVQNVLSFVALYSLIVIALFFSVFALILPAIFIGVQWSLAPAALFIEEQGVFKALGRSWELVKDYWWVTFGLIILMTIITTIATYVFVIPTTILSVIISSIGTEEGSGVFSMLYTIILGGTTVISSMLYSIMQIALSLHFFNLVERKEGGALRSKIENLSL